MNGNTECGEPHVVMIPSTMGKVSGMETLLVMLYGLLTIFSLLRLVIPSLSLAGENRRKRDTEHEGWKPVVNFPDTDKYTDQPELNIPDTDRYTDQPELNIPDTAHYPDLITHQDAPYEKTSKDCSRPVIILVNTMDNSDILHTIMEGIPAFIHHV